MKKKINAKTVIIIILIGIICLLILSNLNQRNTNIQQQENNKKQLGETTENAYVEIQTHLSEVSKQEEKLLSFKSVIANAITEKGIETSEDADATTMASNIKNIQINNSLLGINDYKKIVALISYGAGDFFIWNKDEKPTFGAYVCNEYIQTTYVNDTYIIKALEDVTVDIMYFINNRNSQVIRTNFKSGETIITESYNSGRGLILICVV